MDFTLHPHKNSSTNLYACIISGDGIFNPLARYLADQLAQSGIPTARVKSIKYFWNKRSPKRMSNDLKRYINARLKRNPSASFVFIGYSFGAGTLPFALNRLPINLQEKITSVFLIAPPAKADFEFFFKSWRNKASDEAKAVAPEIQTLSKKVPVLYIHGVDDYVGARDGVSTHETLRIVSLEGGHTFDKNYAPLFDLIKSEISNDSTHFCQSVSAKPKINFEGETIKGSGE